jgi:hypothetical protein
MRGYWIGGYSHECSSRPEVRMRDCITNQYCREVDESLPL